MRSFSIQKTVPIAFLIPLVSCVGLVAAIAWYTGQKAVDKFSQQIMDAQSQRIRERLGVLLRRPHLINQLNADAISQGQLDLSLDKPDALLINFWSQSQIFNNVNGIQFGYEQGGQLRSIVREGKVLQYNLADSSTQQKSAIYEVSSDGKRGKEIKREGDYDARKRPWYKAAVAAGKPIWTPVSPKKTSDTLQLRISGARPIFDKNKRLVGVISSDFFLNQINDFLSGLSKESSKTIFIIEPSGKLIAASDKKPVFDDKGEQILATKFTQNPLISQVAQDLEKKYGNFQDIGKVGKFKFHPVNGEKQLIKVSRMKDDYGLDWWLVIAVPESSFTESLQQTRNAAIVIIIGTIAFSIFAGVVVSNWLVVPIVQVNQAAKHICDENQSFEPEKLAIIAQRGDELGELARVFQEMANTVQDREANLKNRLEQMKNESEKVKKAALESQMSGNTNIQALLLRSREARDKV
ncbi:PDC sensor domain-containing protein [Calothrix sp. 336/3]|uniref:PDC sensor domain-containing protein n=1 Tax=Calothrix sp. 336/3 TaxID=1337936 RepID=UPI0004E39C02|nr:cache domain-containing protein [Calothrix sp. 336/3]AKG20483.1 hypothetical protein IJ00_03390 [Calothrix sp. 336/3]